MNSVVRVFLNTTPQHAQRLAALQHAFAAVCNALAPLVQQTRCWNRVALHHMAYKQLRQQFPGIGSQMVCNAIYSVSRSCRVVYQHPKSPFNLARLGDKPLPRLHFLPQSPVYFDRHTLSIKDGQVSMYTLDGRMRFQINLASGDEQRFRDEKLREIVLSRSEGPLPSSSTPTAGPGALGTQGAGFQLAFYFAGREGDEDSAPAGLNSEAAELPEYVLVASDDSAPATPLPLSMPRTDNLSITP